MAGGGDAHLGGLVASCGLTAAEGLEDFGAEVLGPGDRAAGGRFVTGGFRRAVGLGAGDGLTREGLAHTHLPGGIRGCGLLGAMAIGATGAGSAVASRTRRTGFALELTNLLCQLTGTEVGVDLTGHSSCTGLGRRACGLAALAQGFAARQDKCPAGVVDSRALAGCGAIACGSTGGAGGTLSAEGEAGGTGRGGIAGRLLALALVLSSRCRCGLRGFLGDVGAGAVLRGVGTLAAAGHGLATGQHQIAAGVRNALASGGTVAAGGGQLTGRRRSGCGSLGCGGTRCGTWSGVGPGRTGIRDAADATATAAVATGGFLAAVGEGLAALKGCFATRFSGHVRPVYGMTGWH